MNSARIRSIFVYVLIVVAIIVLLFQFRSQASATEAMPLTDLAAAIQKGEVQKIVIDENTLHVTTASGEFESRKEPITTTLEQLAALGVTPEQFRSAFSKVTPAPQGQRPTEAQREANRKILSQSLGVSPERLDEVMDKYRPEGRQH